MKSTFPNAFKTIQGVFKNAQKEEKGIYTDGDADDVALATEDVKDVEHQLNTVKEESLKISLKIHTEKIIF